MNTILKLALAATLLTVVPVTSHAQSSAAVDTTESNLKGKAKAQDYKAQRYAKVKAVRKIRATINQEKRVANRTTARMALRAAQKANTTGVETRREKKLALKKNLSEHAVRNVKSFSRHAATAKRNKLKTKTQTRKSQF